MIVYKATNLINNKIYIGITTQKFDKRRRCHYASKDNSRFHKSLQKYKKEDFKWEIIDTALSIDELKEKEIYWINFYNSYNFAHGYNSTLGGDFPWSYRKPMSIETKQKLSRINTGCGNAFFGKKHTKETKKKLKEHFLIPYEIIKKMFDDSKYKLLTSKENYIDSTMLVDVECPNNHKWSVRPYAFKKGNRCKKCMDVLKKVPFDKIETDFINNNYQLISTKEEYEFSNSKYKIKFICGNGHTGSIGYHNFANGHRCKQCGIDYASTKKIKP